MCEFLTVFLSNLTLVILICPSRGSRIFNIITASLICLSARSVALFRLAASILLQRQLLLSYRAFAQVGLNVPARVPRSEPDIVSAGSRRQLLSLHGHPLLLFSDFPRFILHYMFTIIAIYSI